ncbi:MAG: hypothetical protein AAFR79_07710 [Pseudomonadota bacterium]
MTDPMTDRERSEDAAVERMLARLGASASAAAPQPSEALMARVLGDAAMVAAERPAARPALVEAAPSPGRWASVMLWFAGPRLAALALLLSLLGGLGAGYAGAPTGGFELALLGGGGPFEEDIADAALF